MTLFDHQAPHYENWIKLYDADRTGYFSEGTTDLARNTTTIDDPIYYASLLGLPDILGALLSTRGIDIPSNSTTTSIEFEHRLVHRAMQAAVRGGHEPNVLLFLNIGLGVNYRPFSGSRSHVETAASSGQERILELLLDRGGNTTDASLYFGSTLQAACYAGQKTTVQVLLKRGIDINIEGGTFGNALQAASSRGHRELVKLLLDHCANVHAKGGFYTHSLQAASNGGHTEIVKLLLGRGADINADGGLLGGAFSSASNNGHEETVKLLLEEKADVNAQGGLWGNALQAASKKGFAKTSRHGETYWSVVGIAKPEGTYENIVKLLLDAGANVNARGGYFGTAIQAALFFGHKEIIQILLDRGAETNAKDEPETGYDVMKIVLCPP